MLAKVPLTVHAFLFPLTLFPPRLAAYPLPLLYGTNSDFDSTFTIQSPELMSGT